MLPALSGRRVLFVAIAFLAAIAFALPASAQTTGMVKGKVVDGQQAPVDKAKVTIEYKDGINRTYVVSSNKKGEYIQIGLPPGRYKVTAEKEKLGAQSFDASVRLGDPTEVNFVLNGAMPTKEDAAKGEAIKAAFDEGVAASKAGDYDGALAKFSQAATLLPGCYDCYYNIGFAYSQKKEYDKAEEAFKKAIEMKADYVDAYNGLATVYNAQKKFDLAADASKKAVELAGAAATPGAAGGSVDALYNQGVINWNAGKIDEAMKCFQDALKANPDHPDSHYQLGMAYLNQGKMPEAASEFEAYLKLDPSGKFAATAKGILTEIKK
jgi:tetratricopeptide (TPR) repeat protein